MRLLTNGPADAKHTYVFAHGAGGPMDGAFMNTVAEGLAANGIRVVRFEFPYMAARRTGGKRGAPDREPVLLDSWREVINELGGGPKVSIGGKSMGGRMATMIADEMRVRSQICLGYPFHPPGAPHKLRTKHLADLKTKTLIIQGERDMFGTREEVTTYKLSSAIRIEWIRDGDHSFKPRAGSGMTNAGNIGTAITLMSTFLSETD